MPMLANSNFDGRKIVFLEPEDAPLVTVTNAAAARVVDSKFALRSVEIEVDSPAPAVVVVAQTFYHDWHASVDGRHVPLLRANYAFQAVQVPQGRHKIELRYIDRAFQIGAGLAIVAWIGSLTAFVLLRNTGGRRTHGPS